MLTTHQLASSYCLCTVIILYNIKASVTGGEVNIELTEVRYDNYSIKPAAAGAALDGTVETAWSLKTWLTTDSFKAEFDHPYTVSVSRCYLLTIVVQLCVCVNCQKIDLSGIMVNLILSM